MSWFIVFPQEQRQATRENVERKQARTSDELEVKPSILNIYLNFFFCILPSYIKLFYAKKH